MSQLGCGKSSPEGLGQLTTRIWWNAFSQPSQAQLWIKHPVLHSHGLQHYPLSTVVHGKMGLRMFPAFCLSSFPMLLNIFSRPLGEKKALW